MDIPLFSGHNILTDYKSRGHSGDGCDLASALCTYDLRKGCFICSELDNGATSEAGKCLFIDANVWWRCAQYFVIASCG